MAEADQVRMRVFGSVDSKGGLSLLHIYVADRSRNLITLCVGRGIKFRALFISINFFSSSVFLQNFRSDRFNRISLPPHIVIIYVPRLTIKVCACIMYVCVYIMIIINVLLLVSSPSICISHITLRIYIHNNTVQAVTRSFIIIANDPGMSLSDTG